MLLGLRCIWLLHFVPFGKASTACGTFGEEGEFQYLAGGIQNRRLGHKTQICRITQICPRLEESQKYLFLWYEQIEHSVVQVVKFYCFNCNKIDDSA